MVVCAAFFAASLGCGEVDVQEVPGTGVTLCLADFETCINPIFDAVLNGRADLTTCSDSGCHDHHSGSGGGFKIIPDAAAGSDDMLVNFFTAKSFANLTEPSLSKLLLEPLQGSFGITGSHTGGDIFPDTGDPCYQAIHDWISTSVDTEDAATCGQCTPPAVDQCGF